MFTTIDNSYRAVCPKYRMGNVIILDTSGVLRLARSGSQNIYLGNEGFSGKILTNLGVFVDF